MKKRRSKQGGERQCFSLFWSIFFFSWSGLSATEILNIIFSRQKLLDVDSPSPPPPSHDAGGANDDGGRAREVISLIDSDGEMILIAHRRIRFIYLAEA